MRRRGFKPTQTTFTALLKACSLSDSANSVEIARELFDSMSSHGMDPSIININMLLGVYQRKGDVEAMLDCFNSLPAEGATAPTLVSYTMVASALRRELLHQLSSLKDKTGPGSPSLAQPSHNDARRIALIKQNIHQTFDAMMSMWSSFVEDANHRSSASVENTPALLIDSRFVNILLKSCHSVYVENRALGRKGLKIIDQAYGLDRSLGFTQPSPPPPSPPSPPSSPSAKATNTAPLAVRLRSVAASQPDSRPLIDSDTVDLALELCARDGEHTKAIRFWRSLQSNFSADLQLSKLNYLRYFDILDARLLQYRLV
ncbi:hypothetical protein GGI12_004927 [Dipsacomyces acuminosporus]|nr:hypothetical protein GGI12_004927 [Dipsacomyces acuminosporus]